MNNKITSKKNGFIFNEIEFEFQDFETEKGFVSHEIISENQIHIGTSNGVILLDLSCEIDGFEFNNIDEFKNKLFFQ